MLSNKNKTAIAIFVKTPELSPVKTRLGGEIGLKKAGEFYKLSIQKIRKEIELLLNEIKFGEVDVYWSLSEAFTPLHALKWNDHKRIHQKGEGLGEKISSVYNGLIDKGYKKVILLGGDSPQLSYKDYLSWVTQPLFDNEYMIGPADDGGFYTFVSGAPISQELWCSVEYSQDNTALSLIEVLESNKFITQKLPPTFDVDYKTDLDKLMSQLQLQNHPAAVNLREFLQEL